MSSFQTEILSAKVAFIHQSLIKPLQLSTGSISEITEARAHVRVRVDGQEAEGIGSIYLSDLWAWPEPSLSHEERDRQLRAVCEELAARLPECSRPAAHPAELGLRLHDLACHGTHSQPTLARAMCASPFDAAIHDAVGRAVGRSAFSLYEEGAKIPSADRYFANGDAAAAIRATLQPPAAELAAWWIVGAKDDLPSALEDPIRTRGYRGLKIKLLARSVEEDRTRTIEIYDAARSLGCAAPRLSLDSNEGNKDAAEVEEYLLTLRDARPEVFAALEYLEQPTGRDITLHQHDWRAVSRLKPILLDEGLTELSLLPLAKEQGWSGLALKTCKGHSFTLVAAAWAKEQGIPIAMQDLTNPGYAAIHSWLTAAHLGTLNGVELNSPQYTPAANEAWLPRLAPLFELKDGQHRLPGVERLIGLGSDL